MTAPTENLVRARYSDGSMAMRAAPTAGDGNTLFGHFAVFDVWTEIDSWYEGNFMERVAPIAFDDTFVERADKIRVLYDHGHDPMIGNKPIAAPEVMRADEVGAYYEAGLFNAGYVNELRPALAAGQLGASFRMRVVADAWNTPKSPTDTNPKALPERTITKIDLFEFGPVPFPAYDDATAGVRSGTDQFLERLMTDPRFLARFIERTDARVAQHILADLPTDGRSTAPASKTATDGDGTQANRHGALASVYRARAALLA